MSTLRKSLSKASCLVAALGFVTSASAEITFSGFASFVGGKFSEDNYTYAGYDDDVSFSPDTVVGIQLGSKLTEEIKVTAQLVAKGLDDYDVEAELAYLTYAVNPFWDVRVGRIRAPLFYYSDFLDVGYAYPWIRPPSEVYRINTFSSFDGIDTLYRSRLGSWDATYQFFYGNAEAEQDSSSGPLQSDLDNFMGVNFTFNRDWLTLRAGYVQSDFTSEVSADLAGLLSLVEGAGFVDVAAEFDPRNERSVDYVALAAIIDYNDWLVNMEYTTISWDKPTYFFNDDAWFIMVGRRVGSYIFHLTYAAQEEDPDYDKNTIPSTGVPDGVVALRNALNGAIANNDDSSITLGVRYDMDAGVALKAEITRFESDIAEPLFPGQQSSLDDGTLISVGLDVVF